MKDEQIYNDFYNQIIKYKNSELVVTTSEEISIGALYAILENKFYDISSAINDIKNGDKVIKKFFKEISIDDVTFIIFSENNNSFVVNITNGGKVESIRVTRHNNVLSYTITSEDKLDDVREVLDKAEDSFNNLFDVMEEFDELFCNSTSEGVMLSSELFECVLTYHSNGNVTLSPLKIKSSVKGSDISYKKWKDRPTLDEVIKIYHNQLVWKIPIKVADLPVGIQNIIGEYLEKNSKFMLTREMN